MILNKGYESLHTYGYAQPVPNIFLVGKMKALVDTEVIEQTIDALVKAAPTVFAETITNLRAALEAKEQAEPVAFAVDEVVHWHIPHKGKSFLYLHPPTDEKMREDAARYRWLTRNGGKTINRDERHALFSYGYWGTPEDVDAAIDAARAAEGNQK